MIKFKVEKTKEQPKTDKKDLFFINLEKKPKIRFKIDKENESEEVQKKKKIKFLVSNYEIGHWSYEEHKRFIKAIVKYGKDWEKIKNEVQTRSDIQIRSHAQKFYKKLKKCKNEQLGIDFTLDKIHNIKDMIEHIKSVNNDYDMYKIFLYLPKLCKIKEGLHPGSEEEDNDIDIYYDLFNEDKKDIFKKDAESPPQIQNNINNNFNLDDILFINYINNNINNNLNSFIFNYLINQKSVNNGFNQVFGNYNQISNNNNNINNLQQNISNNYIFFNNVNLKNNINIDIE